MSRGIIGTQWRAPAILAIVTFGFVIADGSNGRFLSLATAFSTFETFATIGIVALGLGITMIMREFDLSVAGVFGMAGCVAVLTGANYPGLGVLAAVAVGVGSGIGQGILIEKLRLASIGVTLGGLLVSIGASHVLTQGVTLAYGNLNVATAMGHIYFGVFSIRSLFTFGLFAVAAIVISYTRVGRDIIASGSDRMAARIAGVPVELLVIGAFAFSGACAAFSGALLSYSLASASPTGLSDVLVPALTGIIIGGVSLSGGTGRPLGIACGVLVLAVLRSGFNAIGAEPWISEVTTGAILLVVAAFDAPYLVRRWRSRAASPQTR